MASVHCVVVDRRERVLDLTGQEIMTADKVTLRLNAVVAYRVQDARRAAAAAEDAAQALYREAQLAFRAAIGSRDLDSLLADREVLAGDLEARLRAKAAGFGLELVSLGLRDLVLPGEMKALLNRVTEARKAAAANLITRREEVAAVRNQCNTAKLMEGNPTLLRLRELEIVEKLAANAKLSIVLGEPGLAKRLVNLV